MDEPNTTQPEQQQMPSSNVGVVKKPSKVWMIVAIIAIILLIAGGVYGYIKFKDLSQKNSSLQSQVNSLQVQNQDLQTQLTAAQAKASVSSAASSSDKDQIAAAIKGYCSTIATAQNNTGPNVTSFTIKSINGNYAQASVMCATRSGAAGSGDGPEAILVKSNGNWSVVAAGIGDFVLSATRTLYTIPSTLPKF